jgi:hypothetical protein
MIKFLLIAFIATLGLHYWMYVDSDVCEFLLEHTKYIPLSNTLEYSCDYIDSIK